MTKGFDYYIPDGMPLVWLLRLHGATMPDRVYGPTFMRYALQNAPRSVTHYFIGGFEECGKRLLARATELNPHIEIVGSKHGYFSEQDEAAMVDEINRLSPDLIWIGLGTPKQQRWVRRWKPKIKRGVILTVGFAFDVNAGMKKDAPLILQRLGLTWLFRLISEPRRLAARYFKYNTLFLFYLVRDFGKFRVNKRNAA
jgi:N-acetylglucosaminyldiphosphoundecaprenol N-acetyl-beta-D-mannosaminyltransferase